MKKIPITLLFGLLAAAWIPQAAADSYTDDFSGPLRYAPSNGFALSIEDGVLRIDVQTNLVWAGQYLNFGDSLDLTAAPYMSMKMRTDRSALISAYLFSPTDNWRTEARVYASEHYVEYFFDFSDIPQAQRGDIIAAQITPNGNSNGYVGTIFVDDLRVGDAVTLGASVESIPWQIVPAGAKGRSFLVRGIRNATGIEVSGANGLIENINVSGLSPYTIAGNAFHEATITYDTVDGASGTAPLTVTAIGVSGYADNLQTFDVTVEGPVAPTLDPIADLEAQVGAAQVLQLRGISDGQIASTQELTLSAVSSNPSVVASPITAIEHPYIDSPIATLAFETSGVGTTQITVTVEDSDGLTASQAFEVRTFSSWNNAPTLDSIAPIEIFTSAGEASVTLTGIFDGDDGSQALSMTAVPADTEIVSEARVEYDGGTTATLFITPNPEGEGSTTVTVTLTDDGAGEGNNGNQSVVRVVNVTTRQVLPTTLTWDMADDQDRWEPEETMTVTFPQEGGTTILTNSYVDKWTFAGLWFNHPDIDLSEHPYVSFDIRPSVAGQVNVFVWDAGPDGEPFTYNNAHSQVKTIPANQWTTVNFAFTGPEDMISSDGVDVNSSWIVASLINFHSPTLAWPFSDITGSYSIRNFRIGEAAQPDLAPEAALDPISDRWHFRNPGEQNVQLTGISSGSQANPVLEVSTDNASLFNDLSVSAATAGTAVLSYTLNDVVGEATVTVSVSASGSTTRTRTLVVGAVEADVGAAFEVQLDQGTTYQTIYGFGTHEPVAAFVEEYGQLMGGSAVRFGLIGNQLMPQRDNSDPKVLNRGALDYSAVDWDRVRRLKAAGVETFILSSWSPPGWMKDNLSEGYGFASHVTSSANTDNRLSYHLYEEFAESMVAVVRLFREEAGVDLYAIGLQNEPTFHEPYPSAILDTARFRELIKVVGARFEEEGIETRLYMPEQVFQQTNSMNAYIDAINSDPEAEKYSDIIATHGYASDGVGGGTPTFAAWTAMYNRAQQGSVPKELWMTETYPEYQGWQTALNYAMYLYGALEFGHINLWTGWSYDGQMRTGGEPNMSLFTTSQYYRYIRPGAVRIRTVSPANSNVFATSFINDENNGGSLVSVLVNNGNQPRLVWLSASDGELPQSFIVTRTDEKTKHGSVGTVPSGDLLILPPQSVTSLVSGDGSGENEVPVITESLAASETSVAGTTTTLSITATDLESTHLTVNWITTLAPAGATPGFSGGTQTTVASGEQASTLVTFNAPGEYRFRALISDGIASVNSTQVDVTVEATPTHLALNPSIVTVYPHATVDLTATLSDQFGTAIDGSVAWEVAGGGGLEEESETRAVFRAGAVEGSATVTASVGEFEAASAITVEAATDPAAPVIFTSTLPGAVVGEAYMQNLIRTGGVTPFAWSVYEGSLPEGLSLSEGGVLSGTPAAAGTSAFTLAVTDARGAIGVQALSLTVQTSGEVPTPGWDISQLPEGETEGWIDEWMGWLYYSEATYPWTYHAQHQWIWPEFVEEGTSSPVWVFGETSYDELGWLFMEASVYPWMYATAIPSWIYYHVETELPRAFWSDLGQAVIELDP